MTQLALGEEYYCEVSVMQSGGRVVSPVIGAAGSSDTVVDLWLAQNMENCSTTANLHTTSGLFSETEHSFPRVLFLELASAC